MRSTTGAENLTGYCARVQLAAELIGRRWSASIIGVLLQLDHARFGEIRDQVPGLSDRLLADRLEELESFGIVHRRDDGLGYEITAKGKELRPILAELGAWSGRWCDEPGTSPGRKRC